MRKAYRYAIAFVSGMDTGKYAWLIPFPAVRQSGGVEVDVAEGRIVATGLGVIVLVGEASSGKYFSVELGRGVGCCEGSVDVPEISCAQPTTTMEIRIPLIRNAAI